MPLEKFIFDDDLAPYMSGRSAEEPGAPGFDEESYLRANPEVVEALANKQIPSALYHYRVYGKKAAAAPPALRVAPPPEPLPVPDARASANNVDTIFYSHSGAVLVIGWADDFDNPIRRIRLSTASGTVDVAGPQLTRFRRRDVEASMSVDGSRPYGFCALNNDNSRPGQPRLGGPCAISISFENGATARIDAEPKIVSDVALTEITLGYFAGMEFRGNKSVDSMYALDPLLGDTLISHNRGISRAIIEAASCTRFGSATKSPRGSIIVCLYGRAEYLFLQNAVFSQAAQAADYEFIYVSNSPELIEQLHKIAAIAQRIYDLPISIVALPGNAGFGAANNAAARYANSDRLLIVNPDVLPMDGNWSEIHSRILAERPAEETRLFGSRLFYSDGSLMHAGMYFEIDWGVSLAGLDIRRRPMLRVEHYGKGAPATAARFLPTRPVPAVSGAFISVDRAWFERLCGFSSDYIYGHYEDADLCLRSLRQGVVPYVHDLPLWHLEGKGSTRLPHHEGASFVNRWLFTRVWQEEVAGELLGPTVTLTELRRMNATPQAEPEAAPEEQIAPEKGNVAAKKVVAVKKIAPARKLAAGTR
jgi:GT2 family glycosyltransferase